jgi:hypothetical protein
VSNKQNKQLTHHIMTLPFPMIPQVWQRGVKQTKQATRRRIMTLPCIVSSKLNPKLSILNVEFFI